MAGMSLSRRSFLTRTAFVVPAIVLAPAIVRASSLMHIRPLDLLPEHPLVEEGWTFLSYENQCLTRWKMIDGEMHIAMTHFHGTKSASAKYRFAGVHPPGPLADGSVLPGSSRTPEYLGQYDIALAGAA